MEASDPVANATTAKRHYRLCPFCGTRLARNRRRCDCGRKLPKRRVPAHARTLRDDPYSVYERINSEIHGVAFGGEWTPDHCGVCGKPPTTRRHMDRDHDHVTGLPRGLACPGNQGCNALMPRLMTLERARQVVAYLERVEAYRGSQGLAG